MELETKISGFILAGGRSRRMGTDKAMLPIENQSLLKRMISRIEPFCESVAISGQNPDYLIYKLEMISDVFSDCGPISGLYSVLNYTSTEWNLVVSVDVPFVNEELIRYLLINATEYDCVIPQHDSGVEPLVGLYNRRILPVLDEMIKAGNFKLMNLLAKVHTRYLNCNNLIQDYPRLFFNINRPGDYQSV